MMSRVTPLGKAGHIHTGVQLIRNRKTMWSMLKEAWKGTYKISFWNRWLLIAGLLYIILPFDFDWIPLLGWVDDAAVALFLVKRMQKETQRYVRAKVMERKGEY